MGDTPFSRAILLERVLGDEEVASQIIELVMIDIPTFIESLKAHLDDKNYAEASGAAHRLKGVAGNIGAEVLSNLASDLDFRCRNDSCDGCDQIIQKIETEFAFIRSELTKP